MVTAQRELEVGTPGRGLHEITRRVAEAVAGTGIATGTCNLFLRHTSASLVIQENADPSARHDLEAWFGRLVEDGDPAFRHRAEGPDDMSAHVRAALTETSLTIPIVDGRLGLGTWQGIYLFEHRTAPHKRRLTLTMQGD